MAAANPLSKIVDWFNAQDIAEDEMDEVEPVTTHAPQDPQQKRQRGPLVLRPGGEAGMEIRHPRTLDDRLAIGMDLKHRRTVALDLTRMADADARYFLEFIYGVVFALDATAVKVTDGIYLLAPRGVSVHNDGEVDIPADSPTVKAAAAATAAAPRTRPGRDTQEELFWQGG